jgi:N-glycosylase/DNA lyase
VNVASVCSDLTDLDITLNSGQAFHWVRHRHGWLGAVGQVPVYLEQEGNTVRVNAEAADAAFDYLALDHPLAEICASFPDDPTMQEALRFCRGMRILRQPAWEAVATFITSSMKQVAHIAQISHTLRSRYGKRLSLDGVSLFAYPEPAALAGLREEDLRACALGYRAKNLLAAARMVASGELDLAAVAQMDDAAAQKALCRLPGVGEKVANCALLFGFERLRAFPVDVWIERVIREKYFAGKRKVTPARIREFCGTYFGEYGGYAQQYLFHHARRTWNVRRSPGAARSSPGRGRGSGASLS